MAREIVYVDSADEQIAYLIARFGPQGTWTVRDQRMTTLDSGESVERTRLQTAIGELEIEFREASPSPISFIDPVEDRERTQMLDEIMESAATFASANPPHHPGSLARFPVPVEHYGRAVGVPFPILAVDGLGRRGLFAPPRMAVLSWPSGDQVGNREFDDFNPEDWPPRRLSDWPTPQTARLTPEQLEATIHRFSACWSRVIDAWFDRREAIDAVLVADATEARRLRAVLDPEAMEPVYRSMNPRFDDWVRERATTGQSL